MSPEAFDLLSSLLTYDHNLRPTAREAMDHPFFDSVRARHASQQQPQQQCAAATSEGQQDGQLQASSYRQAAVVAS